MATEPLRVVAASEVESDPARVGWLIDGLWSREGVGVIGGAPKCCKTWLGLDLAVSVAGGTPCLGRFAVSEPGQIRVIRVADGKSYVIPVYGATPGSLGWTAGDTRIDVRDGVAWG